METNVANKRPVSVSRIAIVAKSKHKNAVTMSCFAVTKSLLLLLLALLTAFSAHSATVQLSCSITDTIHGRHGNLLVFFNQSIQGAVCDANWSQQDAKVVCRQLGFSVSESGSYAPTYASACGDMSAQPVITNVSCKGDETDLADCDYELVTNNLQVTCSVFAGVQCSGAASDSLGESSAFSSGNTTTCNSVMQSNKVVCGVSEMQVLFDQETSRSIESITVGDNSSCGSSSSLAVVSELVSSITVPYEDCGTVNRFWFNSVGLPVSRQYSNVVLVTLIVGSELLECAIGIQCTFPYNPVASEIETYVSPDTGSIESNYTIAIDASILYYIDAGYTSRFAVPATLMLNTPVYVQMVINYSADSYRAVVPTCVTSPFSSFIGIVYYLLENNCVIDSTTQLLPSSVNGFVHFVFRSFRFVGPYNAVYLQCTILLCVSNDYSGLCSGTCQSSRRKREASASLQLVSTPIYFLTDSSDSVTNGSIIYRGDQASTVAPTTNSSRPILRQPVVNSSSALDFHSSVMCLLVMTLLVVLRAVRRL